MLQQTVLKMMNYLAQNHCEEGYKLVLLPFPLL